MLRSSASSVTILGAEEDLTLLVAAHLAAWGVRVGRGGLGDGVGRSVVAAPRSTSADALVIVLGGEDGAALPGVVDAIAGAGSDGTPVVLVVLEPGTAEALDTALAARGVPAPSELLVGVPRGRDLFEALESAVTSTADEVAARPGVPIRRAEGPSPDR
ncbi:MAG: hypothetical protein RLZZ272_457 [Actinomycetota bacterium]